VVVQSDAEVTAALSRRSRTPVGVGAGDLARTLGVAPGSNESFSGRPTVNEFSIDLLEVYLDDRPDPVVACAHVVARAPWYRGHWLRGRILVVMNAEFVGTWDVAPRGHPNDGRAEVVEVQASMSIRERLAARRRLAIGTHLPHPRISSRSVKGGSWKFERPLVVVVDGCVVGRASSLSVEVVPDAALVHA
jgi:hypothetical protein